MAEILALYAMVRWRLWRGDLSTTVQSVREGFLRAGWGDQGPESYRRGLRLANATTRTLSLLPADSRCLLQSLVLVGLLSRRQIRPVLIIAARAEPSFEAHAWVEHAGRPLLPTGDFERLVEI